MSNQANIKSKKRFSSIWIIPFLAMLTGLWMIYQYINDRGSTITIYTNDAQGINAGKTEIKIRNVSIGTVNGVFLDSDAKGVKISAEIDKPYIHLLTEDSRIWAVEPRIDQSGISGFSTILSGSYFEFQPGTSQKLTDTFTLLEEPPLLPAEVKGKRYILTGHGDEDVLDVGSTVYYKKYPVGQIESADFDLSLKTMKYQVFIRSPYDELVYNNSLFWIESGISVDLSAEGVDINTGPLSKMLLGGISFGLAEREPAGNAAEEHHSFILSSSYEQSLDNRLQDNQYYVMMAKGSIRGLYAGAPVEYRGIRIGTVVQAPAIIKHDNLPSFMTHENDAIPILFKIEFQRLNSDSKKIRKFWQENIDSWVSEGLRLTLESGNLITGARYISMDFFPNADEAKMASLDGYTVIPSTSSGFAAISDQITSILDKIDKLDVNHTIDNVDKILNSLSSLTGQLDKLLSSKQTHALPGEINESLAGLQQTLEGFQVGSPMYNDLQRSLQSITELSNDIQPLIKLLNEDPNSLIFDKDLPADIQPTKDK